MTVSRAVQAQTVTIGDAGVRRSAQADTTLELNAINRQDCLNDDVFTFPFSTTGITDEFVIETWVGSTTDCTMQENREADVSTCWKVAEGTTESPIQVRVQDIVARTGMPGMATAEVCDGQTAADTPFTVYFVIVNGAGATAAGSTPDTWPPDGQATFDLVGPGAPSNIEAGAGEEQIVVSFDAVSGSSDIRQYRVYCDPPPNADVTPAPGADGGTGCSSTALVAGEPPVDEPAHRCGQVASTAETITADGLENFVSYSIAVASVDDVGNVGPLSEVACIAPKPVTGFFEAYRAAGGTAGGGFCALGARPSPEALSLVALAALGLLFRRRVRA